MILLKNPKVKTQGIRNLLRQTFMTPPTSWMQVVIILIVGMLFIWMPQNPPPIDWDLYTSGFWSNFPQTYLASRNLVAPPWGLILLLPYYLMQAAGARVLSVLAIGWLTRSRNWPLSRFLAITLSPYFLWTMAKSNMDILVMVFPVLLWEVSGGKKWAGVGRGFALALFLLKPQCTILMLIYLLWTSRKEWRLLVQPLGIVAILVIPISLVGTPPLLLQWLANLMQPSADNHAAWSLNNVSLTAALGPVAGVASLLCTGVLLRVLWKARLIAWRPDQTISALFLGSMFLVPYTSQQSLSGGLAFVPSWTGVLSQWLVVGLLLLQPGNFAVMPFAAFAVSLLAILVSGVNAHAPEMQQAAQPAR